MKPPLFYLFITMILLAGCSQPLEENLIITNVNIIDVETGEVLGSKDVVIAGDKITSIVEHRTGHSYLGEVIDGSGKYLIPGLWDMHTHALWENAALFNKLMIANGVTGFRDMWSNDSIARNFQKGIDEGFYLPQRFIYSNHMIDGDPPIWNGTIGVSTKEEAVKVVDSLSNTNTDFIKVYTGLSEASFYATVKRSKAHGLAIVGHIPASMKAADAIPHLKSVEHLYGLIESHSPLHDSLLTAGEVGIREQMMMLFNTSKNYEESINELLVKHNTFLVPTFTLWEGYTRIASPVELEPDNRVKYIPEKYAETWTAKDNQFIMKLNEEMFKVWLLKMEKQKRYYKKCS